MEANTVTIPLRDYLDLLEIKKSEGVYLRGNYHTLYGVDNVQNELVNQIHSNNRYIDQLKQIIDEKNKKLNQSFFKRIFK